MAVVLSWLFVRQAEWRVLFNALRSVSWVVLGAAIGVRLLALVVASMRWQVLLNPVRRVPLSRAQFRSSSRLRVRVRA